MMVAYSCLLGASVAAINYYLDPSITEMLLLFNEFSMQDESGDELVISWKYLYADS